MKKVLGVIILIYIAYGWIDAFLDNSRGQSKLDGFGSLAVGEIVSIKAVNSDYVNVTNPELNSIRAKKLLVRAINNAQQSSIAKRPPKNTKLYIEVRSNKETLGIELMVPLTKRHEMYFVVVDRSYDGKSYTQDSYGRFITTGLYEFLIEAKLVSES